jgi:hypothetical protein
LQLSLEEAYELRQALRHCAPGADFKYVYALEFTERG